MTLCPTLGERLEALEVTVEAAFSARKQVALDLANLWVAERLRLHPDKAHIVPVGCGLDDWDDFAPAVQGWIGHAAHADTWGLRERIFSDIVFTRGAGRTAGRRVIRGGSWNNEPANLRSANRNNNLGFRLAHYTRKALGRAVQGRRGRGGGCP